MGKIDFVITWVDGADPNWQEKKKQYVKQTEEFRYRDWELLPFLFRGIEKYAPWVNHVYLVTDEQVPVWLNTDCKKLTVVDHKEFIPREYLPTFNSHTIELNLHRIDGLAEEYVYFNDDLFLTNPCEEADFFIQGLPCDEAALNGINGTDEMFASILFQNMSIINRYYSNRNVKKHWCKWLNLKYGRNVLRTLLLLPFRRLQGIYNHHGPMSLLKTTGEKLWQRDEKILCETCSHRFRTAFDVSIYLYRYEQLLSDRFVPRRNRNCYLEVDMPLSVIRRGMKKSKSICLNDKEMDELSYESRKAELIKLFLEKFPEKSMFEISANKKI